MDTLYYYEQANWHKSKLDYDNAIELYKKCMDNTDISKVRCIYEIAWFYLIYSDDIFRQDNALSYLTKVLDKTDYSYVGLHMLHLLQKKEEVKKSQKEYLEQIESVFKDVLIGAHKGNKYSLYALSLYYKNKEPRNQLYNSYSNHFAKIAYKQHMHEAGTLLYIPIEMGREKEKDTRKFLLSAAYHNEPIARKKLIEIFRENKYNDCVKVWENNFSETNIDTNKYNEKYYDYMYDSFKGNLIRRDFEKAIHWIKMFIYKLKHTDKKPITQDYFKEGLTDFVKELPNNQDVLIHNRKKAELFNGQLFDPFIELAYLYLREINIDKNKYNDEDTKKFDSIYAIYVKLIQDSKNLLNNETATYVELYFTAIINRIKNFDDETWKQYTFFKPKSPITPSDGDSTEHSWTIIPNNNNTSSGTFYKYQYFKLKFLNNFKNDPVHNFTKYEYIIQTIHEFITEFKKYNTFIELYIIGKLYSYLFKFFHKNVDYFNQSKDYYRLSAEQGYKFACYKMSKIYMNKKNFYPIISNLENDEKWIERSREFKSASDIISEIAKQSGGLNYSNNKSKKKYMKLSKKKIMKIYHKKNSKRIIV